MTLGRRTRCGGPDRLRGDGAKLLGCEIDFAAEEKVVIS